MAEKPPKELTPKPITIKHLPVKTGQKELTSNQPQLPLGIEKQTEIDGVGMGVLSDGTPFLTGRGLARLLGMENLHVRSISMEWNDDPPKPRIQGIKSILSSRGISVEKPHIEIGPTIHAYPDTVCLAVLEYYAFDAAQKRETALKNYRLLAGNSLREFIYAQVGYDPSGQHRFDKWHERLGLNYQSAPKGYFHVFNEAHTVIYELIQAGAEIGEKFVVDISIGQHWSKYWDENGLDAKYGGRGKYPHRYPPSHPQAASNPQESWCYPLDALGAYRQWLQDTYIEGGKFRTYIAGKVKRGELPPSIAQLALEVMDPKLIEGPAEG